ncbi:peptidoglycan endopeptidase [Verrucomicrobiaceae bacterium 227]
MPVPAYAGPVKALLLALFIPLTLISCSSQKKAKGTVALVEGRKNAVLRNGIAYAPKGAPAQVKLAIAAGNRLQNKPYKWGGGHARLNDSGYDCSGAVSYVLREAGLMQGQMPSRGFFKYGKKGYGKWISVYVRRGHVFMTVAGLRLDTGGSGRRSGPRWKPAPRNTKGHVVRHPAGS